jgi:L-2,4-diaminobutyrate transaminase
MLAVDFVADPVTRRKFDPALKVAYRISNAARERGFITGPMPQSEAVGFAPPLVLTRSDAEQIVDSVTSAARQVVDELAKETVLA